jgi:anaerobic selenocysteine-containing dehydrogenase
MLDFMLQTGPHGAAFDSNPGGASVEQLLANPHGVDYGALEPRLPEALRTRSGSIEMAPEELVADVDRLRDFARTASRRGLVLIGRRHLKSNNSWMHNVRVLTKGSMSCSLLIHPDDAADLGLTNGASATVTSRVGTVTVPIEITDGIRPGVVSLPHGWGHSEPGTAMRVAAEKPGVNSNVLTDDRALDPLSGTSVLNGIPVSVVPAH